MKLLAPVKEVYQRWLDKRIPAASRVTLDQSRIFIVPTRAGFLWLAIAILIFLLAANYQNSLAFGLTFFMVSLFMLSIYHTWRNLASMTLVARNSEQVHAGQKSRVSIELQPEGRARVAVTLGWPAESVVSSSFSESTQVTLDCQAEKRGYFQPGRFRVESVYPLGLCRTWSWVKLDFRSLVYPAIDSSQDLPLASGDGEQLGQVATAGQEHFAGLRKFHSSDSLNHVDWKGYARTGEMNTKLFQDTVGSDIWLTLDQAGVSGLEAKLSVITGWCLSCSQQQIPFGLDIPGHRMEPAMDQAHLEKCLGILALYGLKEEPV